MDYADKRWLRKHRRPLWDCITRAFFARRTLRQQRNDALRRGVQIRIESGGLAFIEPVPAQHR
jgi:hypothetical protein